MVYSPRSMLRHRCASISAVFAKREMSRPMHVTGVTAVATTTAQDSEMMHAAISEAWIASQKGEVPVGAVIAKDGREICRAHNLVEHAKDATAHAEMLCLRQASKVLGAWRLQGCTLYVTLEPCPMCAGAILQARVDRVVYGAKNSLLGADGSWVQLFPHWIASDEDQIHADAPHDQLQPKGLRHPFHTSMQDCHAVFITSPAAKSCGFIPRYTAPVQVESGFASDQCAELMKAFFRRRRAQSRYCKQIGQCWSRLCDLSQRRG